MEGYMKTNKKAILSSALILALSLSIIQPTYADEDLAKKEGEISITQSEEENNEQDKSLGDQENKIDLKTESNENKDIDKENEVNEEKEAKDDKSEVNLNDEKKDKDLSLTSLDDKKDEKTIASKEDRSAGNDTSGMLLDKDVISGKVQHFAINLEVPNRRVYDWVKESSTLYYNGKALKLSSDFYTHSDTRWFIRIEDYFELGKTYDFEIKYDQDNKTYAKGSLTLPTDIRPEESHFRLVNLELSENAKRRVFNLNFYAIDEKGNVSSIDGVSNFYANGEKIGEVYSGLFHYFKGEVGKPYYVELRSLDSIGNKLEYSGTFNMPDEGELFRDIALNVVLTPNKDIPYLHVHGRMTGWEDRMIAFGKKILTVNKQFKSYKILRNGPGLYSYSIALAPIPSQGEPEHKLYKNREDAVKAALAALGENKLFNSYEIKQDEDGFYFYMLSVKDERPDLNVENPKPNEDTSSKENENKKIEPSSDTSDHASPDNTSSQENTNKDKNKEKESKGEKDSSSKTKDEEKSDSPQASKNNAKSTNVKTGVVGEAGLFAIIATAAAGLFTSKKNR